MDCFGVALAIRQRLASEPCGVEDVLECQYSVQELLARPFLDPELKVWLERALLVCKARLGLAPGKVDAQDGRAVLISRIFFRSGVLDPVGEEAAGEDARVVHWLKFTRAQALLDQGWCRSAAMVWQALPTPEAQVNCGVAFGAEGNHALALEHFVYAMELGQSNAAFARHESLVLLNAARAQAQSSTSDLALDLYKLALSVSGEGGEEQDLCRVGVARILAARGLYAQAFSQLGNSNASKPIVLQRVLLFLAQHRPGGALGGFTREYFAALPWQHEDVRFAWCHSQALLVVFDLLQESDRVLRDQVLPLTLDLLGKRPSLGQHYRRLLEQRGII